MNSFVVEDDALIQIYIEYVMNNSEQTSKLFSLNKAETKLKTGKQENRKKKENKKDLLYRQINM